MSHQITQLHAPIAEGGMPLVDSTRAVTVLSKYLLHFGQSFLRGTSKAHTEPYTSSLHQSVRNPHRDVSPFLIHLGTAGTCLYSSESVRQQVDTFIFVH